MPTMEFGTKGDDEYLRIHPANNSTSVYLFRAPLILVNDMTMDGSSGELRISIKGKPVSLERFNKIQDFLHRQAAARKWARHGCPTLYHLIYKPKRQRNRRLRHI